MNSQDDLKSQASRGSFVRDMYAKNYLSLTPSRAVGSMMSPSHARVPNLQSLDAAMMQDEMDAKSGGGHQDSQSVVESYKRLSNSYFANPLNSPKELFVPVP